ncbi:hypothetical protein JCM8097_007925 [Rhodosporidiobolus ruineniae]
MSSSGSTTPQSPRRTINDLPVELKKRIVELVAKQDDVYKAWTAAVRPHLDMRMRQTLDEHKTRYAHGLHALSSVTKEFDDLTAPHRFKTLKASRAGIKFQMQADKLIAAMAAAAQSNRIDTLVLHYSAYAAAGSPAIKDYPVHDDASLYSTMRDTLLRLCQLVPHVHLQSFPDDKVYSILSPWSSTLRTLHVDIVPGRRWSAYQAIAGVLAAAVHLEKLHVAVPEDDDQWEMTADLRPWTAAMQKCPPPPIPSPFPSSTPPLYTTTDADANPEDWFQPDFEDEVFPLLEQLVISGPEDAIFETLESLRSRHVPALCNLEVSVKIYDSSMFSDDSANIAAFLPNLPHLRTARVHNRARLHPIDLEALELQATSGVDILDHPDLPIFPAYPTISTSLRHLHRSDHPVDVALVKNCRPFVKGLSTFLVREIQRAERDDDEAAFVGMAASLRALELDRVTMMG